MEIFTAARKQIAAGLLILALAAAFCPRNNPAAADPVPWSYVWSLRLVPNDNGIGALYTNTDISFSAELKNIASDTVSLSLNSLPQNVRLVSSKRESTLIKNDDGSFSSGTRVTLVLSFARAGTYRISPLDLVIDKDYYQLPFDNVSITENPRMAQSEIAVLFDGIENVSSGRRNEIPRGKSVAFTVSVRNAAEIKDINWDIPQNCIFRKISDYELPADDENIPNTLYPIAAFEWTPLTAEETLLPKITVRVRPYNGNTVTLETPDFSFVAVAAADEAGGQTESSYQDADLAETQAESAPPAKAGATRADAIKIAELRKEERRSFPFSDSAYSARVSEEAALGLSSPQKEPSVVLLRLLFGLAALFLIIAFALLFLRKRKLSLALSLVFAVFFASALLYAPRLIQPRAVYSGGKISLIPDESAPQSVTFPIGSVVSVKEEAGGWTYIECNKVAGWTPAENLLFIE